MYIMWKWHKDDWTCLSASFKKNIRFLSVTVSIGNGWLTPTSHWKWRECRWGVGGSTVLRSGWRFTYLHVHIWVGMWGVVYSCVCMCMHTHVYWYVCGVCATLWVWEIRRGSWVSDLPPTSTPPLTLRCFSPFCMFVIYKYFTHIFITEF